MQNSLDNLLLHPQSRLQLCYIISDPPHALLVAAPSGSGKKTLLKAVAKELLQPGDNKAIDEHPYFTCVARQKNKSDISIEQIRSVINALKLRVPAQGDVKRAVVIEDAQFLSIPAQNALLKILEEPSEGTVFLLSVDSAQNVLPTIASRTQKLMLQPVSLNETLRYWQGQYPKAELESAWRLSVGAAGLMRALLNENTEHRLKKAVDDAKDFIKASRYQRLLLADQLGRNKEQFQVFLDALSRTLNFLHHASVKNNRFGQSKNLLASRKTVRKASDALLKNGNSKLIALELVLGLKI